MIKRLIVRHAQSGYNAGFTANLDSEITEEGIKQGNATSGFLYDQFPDIKEFYGITSPYHRCLQTSNIIHQKTGIKFLVSPGPREIMTEYEECEVENRAHLFPHFEWSFEGNLKFKRETAEEFVERITKFVDTLDHKKLLIVTHGSPVTTLYERFLNMPGTADTMNFVRNCAISYICGNESIWFGKIVY